MNKKRILFAAGTALTLCFLAPITHAGKRFEIFAAENQILTTSHETQSLAVKANSGDASAQFRLAYLYETGKGGMRKDLSYAISWYEEAARNGNRAASKKLKTL